MSYDRKISMRIYIGYVLLNADSPVSTPMIHSFFQTHFGELYNVYPNLHSCIRSTLAHSKHLFEKIPRALNSRNSGYVLKKDEFFKYRDQQNFTQNDFYITDKKDYEDLIKGELGKMGFFKFHRHKDDHWLVQMIFKENESLPVLDLQKLKEL